MSRDYTAGAGRGADVTDFCRVMDYDAADVLARPFTKLFPYTSRPYGKLYAY